MKRVFFLLSCLLFTALPLTAQQDNGAPRLLVLPDREHDFGDITHRDRPEHRFELENISQDTVRITHVKSSCGCTVAVPDDSVLASGERCTIDVTFYPPRTSSGPVHKSIIVYIAGRSRPEQMLRIKAQLQSDFELSTRNVELRDLRGGEHVRTGFTIRNASGETRTINSITSALAIEGRASADDFVHPIPIEGVLCTPERVEIPAGATVDVEVAFTVERSGRLMGSVVVSSTDETMQVEFSGTAR